MLALTFSAACSDAGQQATKDAGAAKTPDFANATYRGIEGRDVTLRNGLWEGDPYVEDGASRPRVGLAEQIKLQGDLDGDGSDEFVVLLWQSSGGSGTFDYLAVMEMNGGQVENVATAPLGDRVKIRDAGIRDGKLVLEVTQQGPGDAACCPTHQVTRTWRLESGRLVERINRGAG